MYILICWSVAGRPGTSVLFLGEIPMLPAHTLRPEERVKPAPPVWPTYGWATPALRPTKPAIPRVADRPTLLSRGKAGLDIPQALSIGQLGKRHGPVLLAATERPHPAVAAVSGDNPAEGLPGQEFHQLGEKRFAGVHRRLQGPPRKPAPTSNRGHRLSLGNPQNSWRSEPQPVS